MLKKNTCYVTTPIYYVTAKPHLGSLYSTLLADVIVRWNKLQGKDTFLLTGTDEHGQKVAQAAQAAGKSPKEFVDGFIEVYKDTWHAYDIQYNHFIRTTDSEHVKAVQKWILDLIHKGDIYKSHYAGWYCTPCETFVTETEIAAQKTLGKEPHCPSCLRDVMEIKEEAYFFKLSAYQDKLLKFYEENPDFITPSERAHEVVNFVKSGLKDLSISRKTVTWGIPFPGDEEHVTYVWADALNNYITAIGYGQKGREAEFAHRWPGIHVLGKDIVRFHAIYWPAFLMASDLALPKQLLVHGWIKVDKQKMSKSLGNVIDPMVLKETYGAQEVRYYLMRYIAVTQDSNFSTDDLERAITSDLANDLGNLLNRMLILAEKNDAMHLTDPKVWSESALVVINESWNVIEDVSNYMEEHLVHMALGRLWKYIHQTNAYFHAQEPWKLIKTNRDAFLEVLAVTCHSLRVIATLLWPVLPQKMEALLAAIGVPFAIKEDTNLIEHLELSWKGRTFMLHKTDTLFAKYEARPAEQPEVKALEEKLKEETQEPYIDIQDLAKVELLVGTITVCEEMPKSDKLLKMQIDFGPKGMRQILAGIKQSYAPADLLGKQAIFVTNLKPRNMMGIESQGMMLVSKDADGKVYINGPAAPVPNGTRLQ